MNKTLQYSILGIALALIIIAVIGNKLGWIGGGDAIEITTGKVTNRTIKETVSASGKIFPETEVKLSSDVSGEVLNIHFEEGDSVTIGDLLLEIQPDIYTSIVNRTDAALNQAKANLASSKARQAQVMAQYESADLSFKRSENLYKEGVISDAEYENAVAAFKNAEGEKLAAEQSVIAAEYSVKSAEATLKEARDNLAKTKIFAPMNGIISLLNVEKGERVVGTTQFEGTEALRIANMDKLEIKVDVSENDILRVSTGDTVEVEVDAYIDRTFKGFVKYIANSASAENQLLTSDQVTNFTVEIGLDRSSYQDLIIAGNPFPFKPGMSASVEIQTEKIENTLAVPIQSVTVREEKSEETGEDELQEIVYVYNDGIAEAVKVKTGIQDDKYIRIISGLEEDQEVITGPYRAISKLLEDGDPVEKSNPDKKKRNWGPPKED